MAKKTGTSKGSEPTEKTPFEPSLELVEWEEGSKSISLVAEVEVPLPKANAGVAVVGDTITVGAEVEMPADSAGISLGIDINLQTGEITGGELGVEYAGFGVEVSKHGKCTAIQITYKGVGFSFEQCEKDEEEEPPPPTPTPTPEPNPRPPFNPYIPTGNYDCPVLALISWNLDGEKQEITGSPNSPFSVVQSNFESYYRDWGFNQRIGWTKVLFGNSMYPMGEEQEYMIHHFWHDYVELYQGMGGNQKYRFVEHDAYAGIWYGEYDASGVPYEYEHTYFNGFSYVTATGQVTVDGTNAAGQRRIYVPFSRSNVPFPATGYYSSLYFGNWSDLKDYLLKSQYQAQVGEEWQTVEVTNISIYADCAPRKTTNNPPPDKIIPPEKMDCCDELKRMLALLQKGVDGTNKVLGTAKFENKDKMGQSKTGIAHWFLQDKNGLKYPDPNHIEGKVNGQTTGTNGWLKNWISLESTDYFELIRYLVESNIRLEILFPIAELADIKHKDKLPRISDNLMYPLGAGDKKTIPNLIYLQEVLFKYLNNQLGAMPISVSLSDGGKEVMQVLNLSEAAKHILQFLWDEAKSKSKVEEDIDTSVHASLRSAQAIAQIQYLLVQVKSLCLAIAEDLDFKQSQEVISYPSSIDPFAGKWKAGKGFDPASIQGMKDDEILSAMLKDAEVSVKVIKNDDTKTLRRALSEIRNHTQVLQAQAIKATPEALDAAMEAQQLINTVDELLQQRNLKKAITQGRGRHKKKPPKK
jgi:hypothetical protein